jgi:hypothetical protein
MMRLRRKDDWSLMRLALWMLAVGCATLGFIYWIALHAVPAVAAEPVHRVTVPAVQRITLTREAQRVWGPSAPVARFAAQIHAESTWRPGVCSHAGACGLGQFMPATAQWLATLYPDQLYPVAVDDWRWSVRALAVYNWRLHQAEQGWQSESDRWAAALVSYVGGGGWVRRERRATAAAGDDPDRWWQHVELHCVRAVWACRDSRHYPRRILCELEPRYIQAGWPGQAVGCP